MSQGIEFKDIVQDQQSVVYSRHFGATYPIGIKDDGEPKYVLGPHYPVFFGTWIFSLCLSFFLLTEMYKMLTAFWFMMTLLSNIIFLLSYLNVGFSYPGIASRIEEASQQMKAHPKFCKPCKIVREQGTVHCYQCDLCIYKHDHHCPWIGKCVGGANLTDFYFFLCMCFGNLFFILICVLMGQKEFEGNQVN